MTMIDIRRIYVCIELGT
nr:unnamed protein product [Expression vector pLEAD4]